MPERFELVVVGAGPGGYVAAIAAAQLGLKTAVVEKSKRLGGTCLNIGCIPSKALLDSSELYWQASKKFSQHGIGVGDLKLDLARMLARKNEVVKSLTDGVAFLLKKNNVRVFTGAGVLGGDGKVIVHGDSDTEVEAAAILLATGSDVATLPFLALDGETIVSSTEALEFTSVPEHLIVIGGGFIGLELGSVWARMGAQVSVLEFLPRLLPQCDGEIVTVLQRALGKQGIDIHTSTRVTGAKKNRGKVSVQAEREGKQLDFEGDKVLVAVGRKPYSAGLGLEKAGVEVDGKSGRVIVDRNYRTSVAGIYAIGDLIAGPMLAHKASEEGLAVAEHLAGKAGHVNYGAIPSVIYTHPELAAVGPTEEELKESGRPYKVGKFPFQASGRAKCLDETTGMVKVLTDARTDRLLAMHILGARASDMIAEGVLALEFSASAEDIARTCHAHPTLGESVGEAARAAWFRALHA